MYHTTGAGALAAIYCQNCENLSSEGPTLPTAEVNLTRSGEARQRWRRGVPDLRPALKRDRPEERGITLPGEVRRFRRCS